MKFKTKSIKEIEGEIHSLQKKIEFAKKHNLEILDENLDVPTNILKDKNKTFDFYQNSIYYTNTNVEVIFDCNFIITLFTIKDNYHILNKVIRFPNYDECQDLFIEKYDYFNEDVNKVLTGIVEKFISNNDIYTPLSVYSFNYKYFESYRRNLIFL